ncbi:MAG TPA: PIN domain-containing protein [Terriglobia bacterium]|nr:PIN domain-containing protein [Terriglobia bacterium]
MNLLFADTFYFLALLHRDDAAHERARTVSKELTDPILTTAWVLTEMADALAAQRLRQTFSRLIETLRFDPNCTIAPPTQALFDEGLKLYVERPDKDWTLTGCISFLVMWQHGITQALTGDRHFEQAGFTALLR